jgi:hypothetical protein
VVIVPVLLVTILLTAFGGANRGALFGRAEAGDAEGVREAAGGRFARTGERERVRGAP